MVTKIDSESCREDQMDLSEGRDNIVSSGSVFFWDGMGKNFDLLICLKFYIESDSVFCVF